MRIRDIKNEENVYEVLRHRENIPALQTTRNAGIPYTSYIGAENGLDVKLEIAMHAAAYYGVSLRSVICNDTERAVFELGRVRPVDPKLLALRRGEEHLPEGKISGLRYWRKKRGLSCVKNNLTFRVMGDMLGISRQTIHNYCRRPQVNMKCVHELCRMEGLSTADFYEKYRCGNGQRNA